MKVSIFSKLLKPFVILGVFIIAGPGIWSKELRAESDSKSLYEMNKEELEKVSVLVLDDELTQLKQRDIREKALLEQLKEHNNVLCRELEKIHNDCASFQFLVPDRGIRDLACSSEEKEEKKALSIEVYLSGDEGKCFQLHASNANASYMSGKFCGTRSRDSSTVVEFEQTKGSKSLAAPRFKDLTEITLYAVKDRNGQIIEDALPLNKDSKFEMDIKIHVNGISIFPEQIDSGRAKLTQFSPSRAQVDPMLVSDLGQSSECIMTLGELDELKFKAFGK